MSDNIKYLNDESFQEEIAQGVTLVDFFADWCGPCRMMEPILNDLADDMIGKVKIAKIDIDANQKVTSTFNVTSIPTLIVFKDGQEVDRIIGVKPLEELRETINSNM